MRIPRNHIRLTEPSVARRNGYMETLRLVPGAGFDGGLNIYTWFRSEDGWQIDQESGVSLDDHETRELFKALLKAAGGGK